jgi:hypothetical protein
MRYRNEVSKNSELRSQKVGLDLWSTASPAFAEATAWQASLSYGYGLAGQPWLWLRQLVPRLFAPIFGAAQVYVPLRFLGFRNSA